MNASPTPEEALEYLEKHGGDIPMWHVNHGDKALSVTYSDRYKDALALLRQALTPQPAAQPKAPSPTPTRDDLGRAVREAWCRWAKQQSAPKDSWFVPYDQLAECDKEADRQIGEHLALFVRLHDDACRSMPAPSPTPVEVETRLNHLTNAADDALGQLWDSADPRDKRSVAKRLDEALTAWRNLRAALPAQGWRPIETAPQDGTVVLLRGTQGVASGQWGSHSNSWYQDFVGKPTHWMPLPTPPNAEPGERSGE